MSLAGLNFEHVEAKHEIVFIGRSNVGKSTLMRRLIGIKVRVGRRPGVTQRPNYYKFGDLLVTDMPGYGYMKGVDYKKQERIRDLIVKYFEDNAPRILCAVQVVDAKSFSEVVDRWTARGEVPIDVELFSFLKDLGIPVIVAVNKIDNIYERERDMVLDDIVLRLGFNPPWTNWLDRIAPISAKKGEVEHLRKLLKDRLRAIKRPDLASCFSMNK
ncbi:putative GTPase [Methanocella conradii HZ254]|uniref:Probable GTP-binding protein EngB n=1 Tax=Methanocella conradii (strain DSM 24694 / JCM 17849 / CGMCC 1.5162 / HZ254) TaxID=1041930 RepID=H8I943_METCZ|nr:GTP-binding protein EngB [Methanocella conradii]AFC99046.1 putative GTPase [Methanocella conradii HZ254]